MISSSLQRLCVCVMLGVFLSSSKTAVGKPVVVVPASSTTTVRAVAFSPDGKYLALGSLDNTTRLWDLQTGKQVRILKGHSSSVAGLSYRFDGRRLATAAWDDTAIIWDLETGKQIHTLRGHSDDATSIAFSPNGRYLATGAEDKTAIIWNAESGKRIHILKGHSDIVNTVAFSTDGKVLVTGSDDNKAMIWDVESGKQIDLLKSGASDINTVAFSPDGKYFATGSSGTVTIWQTGTRNRIRDLEGLSNFVTSLSFSPDSKRLSACSWNKKALIWDVATGKQLHMLEGHTDKIRTLSYSPDGKHVATGSTDGSLRIWDASTGKEVARMYSFSHNEDWLIVHADGYVNGSPGAFKKVQWKEGGTTYPFEKYKSTYHRPDLIAKALGRKGKPPVRIKPVRKGKQYALLIGVSKYDPNQLYDLPFAANDVSKLAETLINKATFRKDRVILMTYDAGSKNRLRSPTARNIRRQLKGLVQLCEKDDTILIAFAGHGIQFAGETKNYFCPTDADLSDRKTLIDLEKEVYSALDKRCKARVKLLFVDACRNDPRTRQARSRREIDLRKLNQPQTVTLPRGMAAFFSCKAGQQAFEHKDLKHGVFFHFLIEGLSGKAANRTGQVTLGGLKEYVRDEVKTYAFSKFSEVQIPELRENSTDTIVLIEK